VSDYAGYNVPQLWAMLQPEDGDDAWKQVTAWNETVTALNLHIGAVKNAREELVAAWPPEQSEAAQVFVRYLDEHLTVMQDAVDKASANATGLGGLLYSLWQAKTELQPVYEQWQEYQKVDSTTYSGITGTLKEGWDQLTGNDKTPDGWQQDLQQQALDILSKADAGVAEGADKLAPLAPSYLTTSVDPGGNDGGVSPGAGAASGAALGVGLAAAYVQAPQIPPPSQPVAPSAAGQGGSSVLAGGATGTLPGTAAGVAPSSQPMPGRVLGPVGSAPVVGPVGAFGTPGAAGVSGGRTIGLGTPSGGAGAASVRPVGEGGGLGRRVLPSGGVIGERPAAGGVSPGGARGAVARRVNPVGGVIGEGKAGGVGGRAGGAAGSAGGRPGAGRAGGVVGGGRSGAAGSAAGQGRTSAMAGTGSGRRRGRGDRDERPVFDPDDPWRVEEGVPGVVEPPPEPTRHEPGPGVIGLDR